MTVKGKTILSCGHEDEHGCWGIAVEFDEEQCVAGEGFVPTTVYAHYCHKCAIEVTRQAAYAAGLERAAVIAEESMVLLSLGSPEDGPFTRQDKAVDEARACIATAIRAEKDKTNGPL